MAIWIVLIGATTYIISWAWLFSRVSTHTALTSEESRPRPTKRRRRTSLSRGNERTGPIERPIRVTLVRADE